jgi:Cu2+-exporting ATPase
MMTLIGTAITVSFAYSAAVALGFPGTTFFWELATLVDIMLLGHYYEMKSVAGASRALQDLATLLPSVAHLRKPDGSIRDVPAASLSPGNEVVIKPGERIPVDGTVESGETWADESALTGESKPVPKAPGSRAIAGSLNGDGSITVRVQKTGGETFLSQVMALVARAQESKSRTQVLADRAAFLLTVAALSASAITFASWLLFGETPEFAIGRAVTVMVISCPHALGLAIPLVAAISTSLAAGRGILIRNRAGFESARKLDAVIFDKTGTLTYGEMGVTDAVPFPGARPLPEKELLRLAASVEARSSHPVAAAIVSASGETLEASSFKNLPGKGAQASVAGKTVIVASQNALQDYGLESPGPEAERLASQGKTLAFVIVDGELSGVIALADKIRPESAQAIASLKAMGIRCIMLTGDGRQAARAAASQLYIDDFVAEVLPAGKAEAVREIQARGLSVAMVGDGVNDAPALATADVGIAIGAGTDVAIESADAVLVKSDPRDVAALISLSRATYAKMLENLFWAAGYNVLAIPLAAGALYSYGILLSPAIGAALMSLSTVIVAFNARTLKLPESALPANR